jgi:hypothetical protein
MINRDYKYLGKACQYIKDETNQVYDEDDLIVAAIENKLVLSNSATKWSVKTSDGKTIQFDGYFNLDGLSIKGAYQTFQRGHSFPISAFPVKKEELNADLNFPLDPGDEEFTVLTCIEPKSCLIHKTDLVVNIDFLDDFIKTYVPCSPVTATRPVNGDNKQEPDELPANTTTPNVFTKNKTGTWSFTFDNKKYDAIRDLKGFNYIAQLIKHPNKSISCEELNSIVNREPINTSYTDESTFINEGLSIMSESPQQSVLDQKAMQGYKERLGSLKESILEAEELGDTEESERLKDEQETIIAELKKATGFAGKKTTFQSLSKKTTQAVTSNIKNSLKAIEAPCPELFQHLKKSIQTGKSCTYTSSDDIRWDV